MAKIKFSGLISEIRGQLNETIIQGWKSGIFSVKKMMTSVNNPNSSQQGNIRGAVALFSKSWLDVLTPTERGAWETYAKQKPGFYVISPGVREIIGTNGGIMSGMNAYVMTNLWLLTAWLSPVTDPPLTITPPEVISDFAGTCVGGVVTLTWTPTLAEAGSVVRIWMADLSGAFHKQKITTQLNITATQDVSSVAGAKGVYMSLQRYIGAHIIFQADIVNPSGGKCGGSNTVEVIIV